MIRSTISVYEQNAKTPRLDMLVRMALLHHSSLDYMVGLKNCRPLYLDGLAPSQQQAVEEIIDRLQREFHAK